MHVTRRKRRVALISALIASLAFAWVVCLPPAESEKAYAFLEQHPWLCQVVRLGFVLAGIQDQFDAEIAFASLDSLIIDGAVELGPNIQHLNSDERQPEPPP